MLVHLKQETERSGDDLVLGKTATVPFEPSNLKLRANKAWKAAGLSALKLHECRHTLVSMLLDVPGGVNPKFVTETLGHSNIAFTERVYGHLFKQAAEREAERLHAYLTVEEGERPALRLLNPGED
jgi:integrase